jgi:acetylornithine deacetylase/succinyl-diaminopimelate desuccinylase-like protein
MATKGANRLAHLFPRSRFSAPKYDSAFVDSGFGTPSIDVIEVPTAGNHLRIEWTAKSASKPILLVGHYDTVWPIGTLQRLPLAVIDGKARGPGVFDMKAGLVQGFWAMRALLEE